MEIGGYIGFENHTEKEYHENAMALNTGRNALKYIIRSRNINKIAMPKYICSAVIEACLEEKVDIIYYDVTMQLEPVLHEIVDKKIFLLIVNYFGQLGINFFEELAKEYKNLIVDNTQAFFEKPAGGIDTIYSCRKFFGVPDGAYLYTDVEGEKIAVVETSCHRMEFLLGQYEVGTSKYYMGFLENEKYLKEQEVKKISLISRNILRSVDYMEIRQKRTRNYRLIYEALKSVNQLKLRVIEGAYMYPLLVENGKKVRELMHRKKIFAPLLWASVKEYFPNDLISNYLSDNIIPLPCDQRYTENDIKTMLIMVLSILDEVD